MKIHSLFLPLPILLGPALVEASDTVKHGSSAILSLRQLADGRGDRLPPEILNVVGQTLLGLERYGVWFPTDGDKRWVPLTEAVAAMKAFRDAKSSEETVMAVWKCREQYKDVLLQALSAQWKDQLERLLVAHRQDHGTWHPAKAYGAGLLAYNALVFHANANAAFDAAGDAALYVAGSASKAAAEAAAAAADYKAAFDAAMDAAWGPAWNAASIATAGASWTAREAIRFALPFSLAKKLWMLNSQGVEGLGSISYDLAELFALLWLTEGGQEHFKIAFETAYNLFPEMELQEVKAVIEASIKKPLLKDNLFMIALWRDLDTMEKLVLTK